MPESRTASKSRGRTLDSWQSRAAVYGDSGLIARVTSPLRVAQRLLGLCLTASRKYTWLLLISTLLAGVLPAIAAEIGRQLVDVIVAHPGGTKRRAIQLLAAEGGVMFVLLVANRLATASKSLLAVKLSETMQASLLAKAASFELPTLEQSEVQDALTRSRRQAASRPLSYLEKSSTVLRNAVLLGSSALLLVDLNPIGLSIALAAAIPGFLLELRLIRAEYELELRRTKTRREQNYIENLLTREEHAAEVRLLKLGDSLIDRFRSHSSSIFADHLRLSKHGNVLVILAGFASTAAFYLANFGVVHAAIKGVLGIGAMTMALVLFRQCQNGIAGVLSALGGMVGDHFFAVDLFSLLDYEDRTTTHGSSDSIPTKEVRSLEFKNVSFAYPGSQRLALRDVSFIVEPGKVLGIVGSNGSGKSSLIRLVAGLYRPTEGTILLDGLDAANLNSDERSARLSFVLQDFAKYKLTLGENIDFGDLTRQTDNDEARTVAVGQAQASHIVARLPAKFSQRLGRGFPASVDVSGGEWQRIALARAFYKVGADIRLFDEPTAALDAASEAAIFAEIYETENVMTLVVAHRLSALVAADEIIFLEAGQIVERGTHEELMSLLGRYAKAFEEQASAYRTASVDE